MMSTYNLTSPRTTYCTVISLRFSALHYVSTDDIYNYNLTMANPAMAHRGGGGHGRIGPPWIRRCLSRIR